jgi:hypothetical protein
MDHPYAPSLYMATISFFAGWGIGLQQLYADEINQGVLNSSQTTAMLIVALVLVLVSMIFRTFVIQCETLVGALIGLATGLAIGYLLCIAIGASTERTATNIWGMPLLRDRINNGSPIYTCPKTA